MAVKFNLIKLLIVTLIMPMLAHAGRDYPTPILSNMRIQTMFQQAHQGFESRWHNFTQGRNFKPYSSIFNEEEILAEFMQIRDTREKLYYADPQAHPMRANPEFERSQELFAQGLYKAPHLLAFDYNRTDTSYNSSNIILNGYRFLALEGPQKPEHVANFLKLLVNMDVKHVVRLTNDVEYGKFKSENYWHGNVKSDSNGNTTLSFLMPQEQSTIPYAIKYLATDTWTDHTAPPAETILALIQDLRKAHTPGDLVAVHCSAGVGRTGTFIAGFLLLHEIDRQLALGVAKQDLKLSIEELVYKLSLQRAYAVGEPAQYLALHKLVKIYLDAQTPGRARL